jgi:hypothetical protein
MDVSGLGGGWGGADVVFMNFVLAYKIRCIYIYIIGE